MPPSKVTLLRPPVLYVFLSGGDDRLHLRHLRDWHVPERFVVGHALVAVYRDVYHHGPVRRPGLFEGVPQFVHGGGLQHVRTQTLDVRSQVDGQYFAWLLFGVEADGAILAVAVVGAEALRADRA